jgi:AcrR family transcriptional regulator
MAVTQSAGLVRPAKQARSRATRDRLLETGRELLAQGAFEETHIADLVRKAGCSVGAFYQRFADKDAFFTVLIETAVAEIVDDAKRFAAAESRSCAPIAETLTNCMRYWANTFTKYQGMYQTVLKRSLLSGDNWAPLRELGPLALKYFFIMLAEKCDQKESISFHYRVAAGFQMVFGAMLNATMHRTVLLNLESEELIAWASETLRHCILDELPAGLLEHASGHQFLNAKDPWP